MHVLIFFVVSTLAQVLTAVALHWTTSIDAFNRDAVNDRSDLQVKSNEGAHVLAPGSSAASLQNSTSAPAQDLRKKLTQRQHPKTTPSPRPRSCLVICPATLVQHWTNEAGTYLLPHIFGGNSSSPSSSCKRLRGEGGGIIALIGNRKQRVALLRPLLLSQELIGNSFASTNGRSSGNYLVVASYECLRSDRTLLAQVWTKSFEDSIVQLPLRICAAAKHLTPAI